jgi:hypothetical protein
LFCLSVWAFEKMDWSMIGSVDFTYLCSLHESEENETLWPYPRRTVLLHKGSALEMH